MVWPSAMNTEPTAELGTQSTTEIPTTPYRRTLTSHLRHYFVASVDSQRLSFNVERTMKTLLTLIFVALIFLGCAESEKEPESFTITGKRFVFSAQDAYERNLEEGNLKFLALKIYKDSELIFPGLTEEQIDKLSPTYSLESGEYEDGSLYLGIYPLSDPETAAAN